MKRPLVDLLRHAIYAVVWGSILAILSRLPTPRTTEKPKRRPWRDRLFEAAVLFGILGLIGVLVVLSGLIPVKASSGHWPVTRWFLEFSMARGFSTQSLGVEVPPLDSPSMVLRGATQYETTCRPCHGAPDLRAPRVASAMTPTPPYLPTELSKWSPAELFSIVKHGIKFTGMPGWPVQNRDDEVWAMVAFLLHLPSVDAAEYERLAFGEMRASEAAAPIEMLTGAENLPRSVRERCARCHGADGQGRGGAFPKLAGQHAPYLYNALRAFRSGRRHSGIMEPVAAGLSDTEMRELAVYYSGLDAGVGIHDISPIAAKPAGAAVERGREIALRGIPSLKVPACSECHGPTDPHPRREYPMLAGQYAEYMVLQLELLKEGNRGGSPYVELMHEVVPNLTPQQIRDVAAYYGSLR